MHAGMGVLLKTVSDWRAERANLVVPTRNFSIIIYSLFLSGAATYTVTYFFLFHSSRREGEICN